MEAAPTTTAVVTGPVEGPPLDTGPTTTAEGYASGAYCPDGGRTAAGSLGAPTSPERHLPR